MIKNDPYEILKKEQITSSLLDDKSKEALAIYDETLESLKDFPNDKSLKKIAEKIGKEAIEIVGANIKKINTLLVDEVKEKEAKQKKKAQSKLLMEKSKKTTDHLAKCREAFREERKRKIAAGEIKAPVKKRLTTKLKESMKKQFQTFKYFIKLNLTEMRFFFKKTTDTYVLYPKKTFIISSCFI